MFAFLRGNMLRKSRCKRVARFGHAGHANLFFCLFAEIPHTSEYHFAPLGVLGNESALHYFQHLCNDM
jgi:hypothetical protein